MQEVCQRLHYRVNFVQSRYWRDRKTCPLREVPLYTRFGWGIEQPVKNWFGDETTLLGVCFAMLSFSLHAHTSHAHITIQHTYRSLPCIHAFHRYCIDKWLSENKHCPVCMKDVLEFAVKFVDRFSSSSSK